VGAIGRQGEGWLGDRNMQILMNETKIKILIVCSGNALGFDFKIHQAFIYDQIEAICRENPAITYECFFVKGKGINGYYNNLPLLKIRINEYAPDVIHAHGGHTGLLCAMQKRVPVVVTFHGSDINLAANRLISAAASLLCSASIFVSRQLEKKMPVKSKRSVVIPCGVDIDVFLPIDKQLAKKESCISTSENYVLFSSAFENAVKNYPLAQKALSGTGQVHLKEIKNRSRKEVNYLLNGAELLLLTSFSEGSSQIIKEAMACNCPIVAADVGDIREVIGDTEGCFITSFDPADIAEKIKLALAFGERTNGRQKIAHLDNRIIAGKIVEVYREVMKVKG
jgi:glycosyltransferase involved in cell wall biosynthesis